MNYRDGLRATLLYANNLSDWTAAWRDADTGKIESTLFWTQEARPFMHFAYLLKGIEQMINTGKPAWPVERTLLTTGILNAYFRSKQAGGRPIETPWLDIRYHSDHDWHQPPPPPPGRVAAHTGAPVRSDGNGNSHVQRHALAQAADGQDRGERDRTEVPPRDGGRHPVARGLERRRRFPRDGPCPGRGASCAVVRPPRHVVRVRKSSMTATRPPPITSTRSLGNDLSPPARYATLEIEPLACRSVIKHWSSVVASCLGRGDRLGEDAHRRGTDQECRQIDGVARLADDAAASFGVVLKPVVRRERTGVEADRDSQRRHRVGKKLPHFGRCGREAAIESDHQQGGRVAGLRQGGFDLGELLLRETQRLLDEHRLARLAAHGPHAGREGRAA